jgi:hypothetical protein
MSGGMGPDVILGRPRSSHCRGLSSPAAHHYVSVKWSRPHRWRGWDCGPRHGSDAWRGLSLPTRQCVIEGHRRGVAWGPGPDPYAHWSGYRSLGGGGLTAAGVFLCPPHTSLLRETCSVSEKLVIVTRVARSGSARSPSRAIDTCDDYSSSGQ